MATKAQKQDKLPPRGKILKAAATGKEREDALRSIDELSRRASVRAKALGLTEADIQKMINEP